MAIISKEFLTQKTTKNKRVMQIGEQQEREGFGAAQIKIALSKSELLKCLSSPTRAGKQPAFQAQRALVPTDCFFFLFLMKRVWGGFFGCFY